MIKDGRRLGTTVALSIFSFGTALGVGLYVYRFLWKNLAPNEFSTWFVIFELSQFLLLLDFGFTHKFIAHSKRMVLNESVEALNGLRFVLFVSAIAAAVGLLVITTFVETKNSYLNISFVCLSFSLFFNMLGYAETAALRVQQKNNEINIIAIASQVLFILLIFIYSYNASLAIGIAVLSRSFFVYAVQIFRVNQKYAPRWYKKNHFGGPVVVINLAYFILFMLDAALLNVSLISTAIIAVFLVVKKYFDLLRALWDSILPNFYTRFLEDNDSRTYYFIVVLCAGSYILSVLLATWIIPIWLGLFAVEFKLYLAVGLSFFGISIFRISTIRMYYKKNLNWKLIIGISIIVKLVFSAMIISEHSDTSHAYLVQGLLLMGLIFSIEIFHRGMAAKFS